ncbi:hypothetical protein RHMOL_Rhmol04G0016400 [Rhododendron molle]|uniref:Uncharacterized protein n=1 Tax=Rhododendron molle TaxID=49168 RepID=A0ACC0NYD1_RHOML|nr:hypothetical protein RHMOL_Rhmol04G0016400 [Rhododendron molle]
MEGSISAGVLVYPCANTIFRSGSVVTTEHSKSGIFNLVTRNPHKQNPFIIKTHRFKTLTTAAAINDVSAAVDPAQAEISWQIVVGALAGVTPFVVAGIEFSKRIAHIKARLLKSVSRPFKFVPDPPKAYAHCLWGIPPRCAFLAFLLVSYSSEKVWSMWRLRTCSERQKVLLPLPWLRWISSLAIMETILFWLKSSFLPCYSSQMLPFVSIPSVRYVCVKKM